jgi:indole-3-glycerol phosphate synthase
MNILDEIISTKKKELVISAELTPVSDLEKNTYFNREVISLSESLNKKTKTGIIAEFKRKSPSKGIINATSEVTDVTSGYFREGASGVSILTDTQYFGGSLSDLAKVRESGDFPILRKDFIISEYQVIESKAIGSDVILLIAAVLTKPVTLSLARLARSLGMEVLLEIHNADELIKINQYVNIIGVNNRNLKTFEVNTDLSLKISNKIPDDFLKISESGISSPQVIKSLKDAGYKGFLMGEKFMLSADPVKAFSKFINDLAYRDDKN